MALHGAVGNTSSHPASDCQAVFARIASLVEEEERGNAKAPQRSGTLPSGISQNGAADLPDDGVRVRGVVRNAATFCANYSRRTRSQNSCARRSAKDCQFPAGSSGTGGPG